jgi:hypothetical protein
MAASHMELSLEVASWRLVYIGHLLEILYTNEESLLNDNSETSCMGG